MELQGCNDLKGQINLEFLTAALVYVAGLAALITLGSGALPEFSSDLDRGNANLEARQVTTQMLSDTGFEEHDNTENWHLNDDRVRETTSFGLSNGDYFVVDRDKLENIRTTNHAGGENYFNYSQFLEVTDADKQYNMVFRWIPIVHTSESFIRGNPPEDPNIEEPDTQRYNNADNRVHYGSKVLNGEIYYFLVTAQDGSYRDLYVSSNWDFEGVINRNIGDSFDLQGEEFSIENFQNRENQPGSLVILSQELKEFGADPDSSSDTIRMDRMAVLEEEPLRVEVLAW